MFSAARRRNGNILFAVAARRSWLYPGRHRWMHLTPKPVPVYHISYSRTRYWLAVLTFLIVRGESRNLQRGGRSLPFPFFSFFSSFPLSFSPCSPFLYKQGPLNQQEGLGECSKLLQCVGWRPATNEFGALSKATGGNHFAYSEYHVLQQNDQNLTLASVGRQTQRSSMAVLLTRWRPPGAVRLALRGPE